MPRTKLPFQLSIAKPCEESWAEMTGSFRERHCELCDKQVHNLAAMTPREIERLVANTGGRLCARITQRNDGSLVTLEERSRASMAARIVASASLTLGAAAAMAQAPEKEVVAEPAVLTGTVLKPDASGPVSEATITLIAPDSKVLTAKSDGQGKFRIVASPGTYDVLIRQNALFGTRVYAATLHQGEQSLDQIKTHFYYVHDDGSPYAAWTTMGVLVSEPVYTLRSGMRHPWSYLKYLARKI